MHRYFKGLLRRSAKSPRRLYSERLTETGVEAPFGNATVRPELP